MTPTQKHGIRHSCSISAELRIASFPQQFDWRSVMGSTEARRNSRETALVCLKNSMVMNVYWSLLRLCGAHVSISHPPVHLE